MMKSVGERTPARSANCERALGRRYSRELNVFLVSYSFKAFQGRESYPSCFGNFSSLFMKPASNEVYASPLLNVEDTNICSFVDIK
jgi:hypothetical protein